MTRVIDLIAGARPNFMKIKPIIDALDAAKSNGSDLDFRLVHTGQHYDRSMSGDFFDQLGIPEPATNLASGSGTQAEQTGNIMKGYEHWLSLHRPRLCLVVGDVTSTLACSIVARKAGVEVAHVEGGLRSGDWSMPEEINRVVTDSISNWFFTTSELASENLRSAGVDDGRIFFVGNVMIDTLRANEHRLFAPAIWQDLKLAPQGYVVVTLHRPSNVDDPARLEQMLEAISEGIKGLPAIFPVHPRTAASLRQASGRYPNLHFVEPLSYLEFNFLVRSARAVITDSGGVTEETTVLGVPCLTLRDSTERPETVTLGTNVLVGTIPADLLRHLEALFAGEWKQGGVPPLWDGHSAGRIVSILDSILR
jgi:UDP-N-acetylglucosamine 2-epimerase (non-hydrolysing)